MNNIIFTFLIKKLQMVEVIMVKLKKHYDFIGDGDL